MQQSNHALPEIFGPSSAVRLRQARPAIERIADDVREQCGVIHEILPAAEVARRLDLKVRHTAGACRFLLTPDRTIWVCHGETSRHTGFHTFGGIAGSVLRRRGLDWTEDEAWQLALELAAPPGLVCDMGLNNLLDAQPDITEPAAALWLIRVGSEH